MGMDVDLDSVTMRFGDFTAVQNANLTVKSGKATARPSQSSAVAR